MLRCRRSLVSAAPWFGLLILALLTTLASASALAGRPSFAIPYLRGERVMVSGTVRDFGTGKPGDHQDFRVEVVNRGAVPIQIFGAQRSCSCMATEEFPLDIAPGQARELNVKVVLPEQAGPFEQRISFFTDSVEKPRIIATIRGEVVVE